ncbi:F0F1 ATP synthase subunit delta [Cohnella zeiphila]|uniref:ATP synthase subunit delta n=1 Tax=Cohnella zeiphila TaxID=2761120 RepID=A0A7X0SN85_9BACL|nr:F0F1 ATP synthase subunit delta [Cohnella zeiphila]MBB6732994.1 F0F1 ATP synthase subunit delta [Cohnella zeiphila]
MSRSSVVAKRYAKALFELAREQGKVSETEEQLQSIVTAIGQLPEFRAFLSAPNIQPNAKVEAVNKAFAGAMLPFVLHTVGLLIERGRQGELDAVLEAYLQVAGEALGRADAQVTSAKPLAAGEKERLAAKFSELLGKTVRVHDTVDSSLLGGLTVRIGDTLYDGSLRGKLERMDKALQTSAN